MSFWREDVIEFALDHETRLHMDEQRALIQQDPQNPKPYYALSHFYRMNGKQDEALGLLLETVRLDAHFAQAHASLCEIYAIRGDYPAAWRHARAADLSGEKRGVDLLAKYGVPEETEGGPGA